MKNGRKILILVAQVYRIVVGGYVEIKAQGYCFDIQKFSNYDTERSKAVFSFK